MQHNSSNPGARSWGTGAASHIMQGVLGTAAAQRPAAGDTSTVCLRSAATLVRPSWCVRRTATVEQLPSTHQSLAACPPDSRSIMHMMCSSRLRVWKTA